MPQCMACREEIPASAVSRELGAARCPACGGLNDLRTARVVEVGGFGARRTRGLEPVAQRELAPIPAGWVIETGASPFDVRWRWFQMSSIIMIPFTLFWNGILLVMASGVAFGGHPAYLLFGLLLPHTWVGIGLGYATLASLFNTTRVRIDGPVLRIELGPIPWRGNHVIPTSDLEQLFVVEHQGSRSSRSWELCAVVRDGRKQSLVRSLDAADKGRFLEDRLEAALSITDTPVAGEVARRA